MIWYFTPFIGQASAKNKVRRARYLANKCWIASQIDCFSERGTTTFGEKLLEQVEEPLVIYDKRVAPRKNIDVMKSAIESVEKKVMETEVPVEVSSKKAKKKQHKSVTDGDDMAIDKPTETTNGDALEDHKSEKKKKKK